MGVKQSGIDRVVNAYLSGSPEELSVIQEALASLLALLQAQALSYQTSHWQTKGKAYYGNHLLFGRLYEGLGDQIDELAEKMVGYMGTGVVDMSDGCRRMSEWVNRWSTIDCHFHRGLQSEEDCQAAIRRAFDGIEATGKMTLGLEDWLAATASAHETATYLLQQVMAGNHHHDDEAVSAPAPVAAPMTTPAQVMVPPDLAPQVVASTDRKAGMVSWDTDDVLLVEPVPSALRGVYPASSIGRKDRVMALEPGDSGTPGIYSGLLGGGQEVSFYPWQVVTKTRMASDKTEVVPQANIDRFAGWFK